MQNIQGTAIIRDRGQLTIPDKVRAVLKWIVPNSVITLKIRTNNELVIQPYTQESIKRIDWSEIWNGLKKVRSFRGKNNESSSQFIIKDRYRH